MDTIELWLQHTDTHDDAEKALHQYQQYDMHVRDARMRGKYGRGYEVLYLHGCGLTSVPVEITELTNLVQLTLNRNKLRTLSIELGSMTNLKSFHCGDNQLADDEPQTMDALKERWTIHQRRCIKRAQA